MSGWGCRFGFVFTVVVFSQVAAGGMRTVLVDGDMDPTSGLPFHWFEEAVINDNGDIAFVGGRRGAASDSDTGIWSTAGGLHRVGLEGTDLEGHSDGSLFTHYEIRWICWMTVNSSVGPQCSAAGPTTSPCGPRMADRPMRSRMKGLLRSFHRLLCQGSGGSVSTEGI